MLQEAGRGGRINLGKKEQEPDLQGRSEVSGIIESKKGNSGKRWLNPVNYLKEDQERV